MRTLFSLRHPVRRPLPCLLAGFLMTNLVSGQESTPRVPLEPKIAAASSEGVDAIAGFTTELGWEIRLFAAEPDVANIVAFDVDRRGRIFVCETFRQNRGVTDNRGHDETWLKRDLAAQTVADRIAFHRDLLGDEVATYTEQDDRLRLLEDTNGDGQADKSTVYAAGFNRLEDGTGAGVLARDNHVFYTNIPALYDLIDGDGDGVADERVVLSDGYGVRVAFRGHDMHGLVLGPDGRLYFSIGDRGYHVTTAEGGLLHDPASGAVFRCELDGSNLEVFARGLRNPQELAFNDVGDLFTGDNNSDSGDQARLVHVLQDGDTGWRMYYQYLPDRGPFNQEKIWQPFHDEQPAYLVPPITNFADGPSGLTYYPGTGFGDALKDTFLLADFRGTPGNSGIRSFKLTPDGAFYKLAENAKPLWSILATDVAFGPDGALYVSDWVNGWDGEGKGRIYRVSDPEHGRSEIVNKVQKLLAGDWSAVETTDLQSHLAHVDRRVRSEAQLELARRGDIASLVAVAADEQHEQLPRLHAIWGLEQIVRGSKAPAAGSESAVSIHTVITDMLATDDPVLRSAAVQFIGQHPAGFALEQLAELLADDSARVRYFAARAVGETQYGEGFAAVVEMLAANDNRDPALRHGGIMALVGIGNAEAIAELASHPSANVRRAAVVALRHLHHSSVEKFLADGDIRVVAEAARAIHDLPITESLPALAALIERPLQDTNVLRRVLNANYRLGGADNARALASYAGSTAAPENMRLEALAMLSNWQSPDERDRVLNDWRPLGEREQAAAANAVQAHLAQILGGDEKIRTAAVTLAADLGMREIAPLLVSRVDNEEITAVGRAASLRALAKLAPQQALAIAQRWSSAVQLDEALQIAAIVTLAEVAPRESAGKIIAATNEANSVAVRQAAWDALATIKSPAVNQQVAQGVTDWIAGNVPAAVALNIIEAAESREDDALKSKIAKHVAAIADADPVAKWSPALDGGDPVAGQYLFFTKTELSCVRCHKIGDQGGEVGPDLSEIAKEKDARYLLEAIVLPDAQIAKGFETTVLADDLGTTHIGIVRSETDEFVELVKADGSQVRIPTEEIIARRRGQSAMPADLVKYMTPRELRDLVAYLNTLKVRPKPSEGH